jgi:lysozyme family protein
MANFENYLPLLLKVEGGYQANPEDRGNFNSLGVLVGTQRGISARFYEDIINRPPSVDDIKAISKTRATNLFRTHFWNKLKANSINNQSVANTVVDHQVNAGDGASLAQSTLNNYFNKNLAVDNAIGPLSLAAINSVDSKQFVEKFNQGRERHYRSLSNSPTFLEGWLIRLQQFGWEYGTMAAPTKSSVLLPLLVVAGIGYYIFKK